MDDGVKINKRRLKSAVLLIMLALLLASAGGCSKDSQKNGEIDMLPHSTAPALGMPDQGSSGGGCSAV